MYSGKRWWGEWDIRQGSRIPLAPPSSQMVASLQGHYSCITAYVSRVHFIYTEYMQHIYSKHIQTHIQRDIQHIRRLQKDICQPYYSLVEGVCSSAVKAATSYQMTLHSWNIDHWSCKCIKGEDFDNTKASSSPFHIMLAPIIIWKKWEPRNPVPALFRAYWKLGKNTKTLDLRLKYSEKYSKFILSFLEFSSNVTITCTQCVAHLLE